MLPLSNWFFITVSKPSNISRFGDSRSFCTLPRHFRNGSLSTDEQSVSCFYRRLIVYQNYSPLETIKQKKRKKKKSLFSSTHIFLAALFTEIVYRKFCVTVRWGGRKFMNYLWARW
jgi:hypothetical protein